MKKVVLWSNVDVDVDNDFFDEFYPDYDEYERYRYALEDNEEQLYEIRSCLNIKMSQPILVIGRLGLWNGTFDGYSEISSRNVGDCLYDSSCDVMEWYIDKRGDLCGDGVHHDGRNHYLYRAYKDGVYQTQIDNLKDKIYHGKATRRDITRLTKSLGGVVLEACGL